jgi:hypothetical protein
MSSIDQRSRDLHTPTPDLTFDEVETSPDLEETFDIMDLLAMDTTFGGDESITLEVEQSENLGDLTMPRMQFLLLGTFQLKTLSGNNNNNSFQMDDITHWRVTSWTRSTLNKTETTIKCRTDFTRCPIINNNNTSIFLK